MQVPEAEQMLLPPALLQVRVQRSDRLPESALTGAPDRDWIANEVPVALSYNGIGHAVMMATPQDMEDFALGFALSEGIVTTPAECYSAEVQWLQPCQASENSAGQTISAIDIHMEIASSRAARLKQRRRSLAGNTGCGVCGIQSLHMLDLQPEHIPQPDWAKTLEVAVVLRAFGQLEVLQPLNALAGSLHAAGWVLPDGQLLAVREDVGRHNALDKLLGHCARTGLLGRSGSPAGFVILSSRASFELVRKCARMGIPAMACVSAPTALALDTARQAGIRLWGWSRGNRAVAYF